jgi:O-methyltransferase involved in polyketide biosynthesis
VGISEGLLVYLEAEQVAALGRDLAVVPAFQRWLVDVVSPGLLQRMQKNAAKELQAAGSPFRFAPAEGPGFFTRCGWRPLVVRSLFATAKRNRRLPWMLGLFAWIPEPKGPAGNRPWSAVCGLARM